MDYSPRLETQPSYNPQRTLERFGYEYPTKPKEKVSLNCIGCNVEGQLTVNDFLTRLKRKGVYRCRACGALEREKEKYTIDWKDRCDQIVGYNVQDTREHYGYDYPSRSTDKVSVCCNCGTDSHQEVSEFWRKFKKGERYTCKPCMAKQEFSKRQDAMFKARDEFWSKEENKQRASEVARSQPHRAEVMRLNNSNEEFRARRDEAASKPEVIKKQSDASKKLWEGRYDEMRSYAQQTVKVRSEKLKKRMEDPLVRSYYSEKGKENWEKPEYIAKQKEAWTPERKQRLIERNKSPEMLAKLNKSRNSTEEFLIRYFLDSLDIEYIPDYVLGPYVFDIFLPNLAMLIEFDGMKWHHPDYVEGRAKTNIRRDKSKTTYVKNQHPELSLMRLNETGLYQKGFLEQKFQAHIKERDFSFPDIEIREVENKEALQFLTLFHYKENQRAASGLKLGAYLDDKLIGIAVYSYVGRREIATSMGYNPKELVELSRFCIHPCYHKNNFGSWLLARSREEVKRVYPYVCGVVTFADSTLDHQGTIYKAAGYELVSEVPEDYHYQHKETGKFMHKRTLWGLAKKMREPESIFYPKHGFEKVWGAKKFKFIYELK